MNNICIDIFQQLSNMLSSLTSNSVTRGGETFTHSGGFGSGTPELTSLGSQGGRLGGGDTNIFTVFVLLAMLALFVFGNMN